VKLLKKAVWALVVVAALVGAAVVFLLALGRGLLGESQHAGEIVRASRPEGETRQRIANQHASLESTGAPADRQILFGDLHAHTTFSTDAYTLSLPMYYGEGAHPPADACDFARFCSALDFWSINDHAEGLTPAQWAETRETIRQCNAVAGPADSPDLVSFLGWEWTQIGGTPEDHYGHKNVVLRDTAEGEVPIRPIASRDSLFPPSSGAQPIGPALRALMILGGVNSDSRQPYHDYALFMQERQELKSCEPGVPVRDLPADCLESAPTPTELFDKLDDWGYPSIVIPHGNAWGIYTPRTTSWDKQLAQSAEPERTEPLVEVFSGHGNSEEYRPWRGITFDEAGQPQCPSPSAGYTPECWRAGELIAARCLEAGESGPECERRAVQARQDHAEAGQSGHLTVPGSTAEDWLDSGQCADCFLPSYRYRPGGSSQYALAITNFDDPSHPKRFRFGFLASSDGHSGRPGTGYKEFGRTSMADSRIGQIGPPPQLTRQEPQPHSIPVSELPLPTPDMERSSSFFNTGGLVAVHSEGRSREAIWAALERREVYGTSGDRILLHFDWLGEGASLESRPMGAEVESGARPRFRVRALGAFEQQPGCPPDRVGALGPERLESLCRGECYHPGDTRHAIQRIEVIRIRPQIRADEPVESLIEDPWRVLPCPADGGGCSVEFDDADYASSGRDATYYVRAIQVPTPTVNADGMRCERDAEGSCIATDPCYGDPRTDLDDDCIGEASERAWSSPIFLVHPR
jgi:hypothetical protein